MMMILGLGLVQWLRRQPWFDSRCHLPHVTDGFRNSIQPKLLRCTRKVSLYTWARSSPRSERVHDVNTPYLLLTYTVPQSSKQTA